MTAFEFLCRLKYLPHNGWLNGGGAIASKAERRRLLLQKAVVINETKPGPDDIISFPINELVFFPNGNRKTTMVYETSVDKSENLLCESSI